LGNAFVTYIPLLPINVIFARLDMFETPRLPPASTITTLLAVIEVAAGNVGRVSGVFAGATWNVANVFVPFETIKSLGSLVARTTAFPEG
jgi:hypothetical protein